MSDSTDTPVPSGYPQAVLFDLLTALLDSWTVWNRAAGSEAQGRAWRADYLRRTYGCGAYQPYEQLVQEAAAAVGLPASAPQALEAHWVELPVWDGARELLQALRPYCRLGVVTNCSDRLGRQAASLLGVDWDVVVTSEEAGFYKPDPRPYALALARLQVRPEDAAFVAGSVTTCSAPARWACARTGTTAWGCPCPKGRPRRNVNPPAWMRRCRGWPDSVPPDPFGRPVVVLLGPSANTKCCWSRGLPLLAWFTPE